VRRGARSGQVKRGAVCGAPDRLRGTGIAAGANPAVAQARATGYSGTEQLNPCMLPASARAGRPADRVAEWGRFHGEA